MRKIILYYFTVIFFSIGVQLPVIAMAQDTITIDTVTWTLQQCIDYAKEHNISINQLKLTAEQGLQNIEQAKYAKYPNLTGSSSQNISNYVKGGFGSTSSYGVNSNVTIYNGGYLTNNIKSQELAYQIDNLSIATSENSIILQITEDYLNVLLAKENIAYLKDVIITSEAQVKQGQQKYDAGTIALKDLLQLKAALASDNYNLATAQNTLRQNLLVLKQLLQLPTSQAFDVADINNLQPVQLTTSLNEAQQNALLTMPEIEQANTTIDYQKVELEKTKATIKPTLSLGGSIGTNYVGGNNTSAYFTQLGNNFNQQLGLTLSVPILDRKVTKTNVAKAELEIEKADLDLENQKLILTQTVERAYINVQNAQNQYMAAQQQLNYTKEAFRIASEELRIGTYNNVEFLQQRNLYLEARQNFLQSKYASIMYTKIYNFYAGVPVTQ